MMVRIRAVERELTALSQSGVLRGSLHLAQGQEACPAGACAAIRQDDFLTCTYRGHGYVIAKGVPLEPVLDEILGRSSGLCKGKGGKMHLFEPSFGLLGTNGIVGAAVGTACGAAMTSWMDGTDRVAMTVFGDGAINQGHAMECFNMAALYSLPVIFFCENNLYAEMTPLERSHGNTNLGERAKGFGIHTDSCDGNDPFDVFQMVEKAVSRARKGKGPTFIEAATYRTVGHYQADPGTSYRSEEEVQEWREKDPIERLRSKVKHADSVEESEVAMVADLIRGAVSAGVPDADQALTEVFV